MGNNESSYPAAKTEGYVDIDRIVTADNLVAIISRRKYDGAFTFAISRTYTDRNQVEKSTSFVPEFLLGSYAKLVSLIEKRIQKLRADEATGDVKAGA